MLALSVITAAVLGASVGSFLNVVIHRVPAGVSVVRPPSACLSCHAELRAVDNIPIVSWLILRGRCRSCGAPISPRYIAVEALNTFLWVASVLRFGVSETAAAVALTGSVLIALAFIDLEHRRLPNSIVFPSTVVAIVWVVASGAIRNDWASTVGALASGAAAFLLFFLIALISGGMGFGDVKLAALVGVVTGWVDPAVTAAAIFAAFLFGGLVGIAALVTRRAGRKDSIPFGPWLAVGCIAALFLGAAPVRAYLGL